VVVFFALAGKQPRWLRKHNYAVTVVCTCSVYALLVVRSCCHLKSHTRTCALHDMYGGSCHQHVVHVDMFAHNKSGVAYQDRNRQPETVGEGDPTSIACGCTHQFYLCFCRPSLLLLV
jgi:hypothetical protein